MQAYLSTSPRTTALLTPLLTFGSLLKQQLRELGEHVCHSLTTTQEAVQIRQQQCHSMTTWMVYDRITEERQQFTSEAAVHEWLNQRYR